MIYRFMDLNFGEQKAFLSFQTLRSSSSWKNAKNAFWGSLTEKSFFETKIYKAFHTCINSWIYNNCKNFKSSYVRKNLQFCWHFSGGSEKYLFA